MMEKMSVEIDVIFLQGREEEGAVREEYAWIIIKILQTISRISMEWVCQLWGLKDLKILKGAKIQFEKNHLFLNLKTYLIFYWLLIEKPLFLKIYIFAKFIPDRFREQC